jgi:transposase-like protein
MTKKKAVGPPPAGTKRRIFTREFKLRVIREVESGKSQAEVARAYQLTDQAIAKWRRDHHRYQQKAFAGHGHAYTDDARVSELERKVGQLTMENDFLKKLLQKLEADQ